MSAITDIILILGFVLLGLIVAWNLILPRITHKLVLRYKTNQGAYIKEYNIREQNRKDGSIWWVSFPFPDIKTVCPPGDAIEMMKGGRKFAEGHFISRDQIMWVRDKGHTSKEGETAWASLEPFTATDRTILVQEYKQSEAERGKSFLSPEFILPMSVIFVFGMLVIGFFIFGPDLIKGLNGIQNQNIQHAQVNLETAKVQARITEALGLKVGLNITQTVGSQSGTPTLITGSETPPEAV